MNIAYMLGALNRGGTETLLLDVCSNLKGTEIKAFLYHRKGGVLEQKFRETGVPMNRFAPKSAAALIPYLWKLRRSLKKQNINIVHAQQSLDAVYASIATAGTGIKVVQTFHGYDFNYGFFQKSLLRLSVWLCNSAFFVSNTQKEYYEKNYRIFKRKTTDVIYNGIDPERLTQHADSGILDEYHVNSCGLKLGMIGNFVPVRDQMTICRFLKLLNEAKVDFTFFFVGAKDNVNPNLFDDCVRFCKENQLNDKVIFTGSRSDVPGILNKLDAVIYSSSHDTFGIAVVEAIMAGKVVFLNDLPVFKEIIPIESNVIFYKSQDDEDLLNKVKIFHESWQEKKHYSLKFAEENYHIRIYIERIITRYMGINPL